MRLLTFAFAAGCLMAQDVEHFFFQQAVPAPPAAPGTAVWSGGASFNVISSAPIGNPVKGAPYSAEMVTESIQTLADGNRIVNRSTTKVFRDSEGRERREMILGDRGQQIITISDPVAGVSYTLDPGRKTATKTSVRFRNADMAVEKLEAAMRETVIRTGGVARSGGPAPVPAPSGRSGGGRGTAVTVNSVQVGGPGATFTTEDLGTRNIEGVTATGKRMKTVVPAGAAGNERPLETIMETWFSAELKMTVLDESTDPRAGKTVMKLTNIIRSEPSRLMFEPGPEYAVNEGPGGPLPAPGVRVYRSEVK